MQQFTHDNVMLFSTSTLDTANIELLTCQPLLALTEANTMQPHIKKEFSLHSEICYLNHAAVSPWPIRTSEAIQRFARENAEIGARDYGRWEQQEAFLRQQLQSLINAPSTDDIALVKNTSEGLSMIAYGIHWQSGDEIIISDEEFPSNRIVWESLANKGVKVIEVNLNSEIPAETHLASFITPQTRMLAISSVQYASGIKLDMIKLGQFCKNRSQPILFCIDAIQSLGAYPLDVKKTQADFVVADGHKWLMAPEGLGLFYSRAEIRQQMDVFEYGWRMIKNPGDYQRKQWKIETSARRFECGSPNMLGIYGLSASLSLLLEYGIQNIEKDLHQISEYLRDSLKKVPGCTLFTPTHTSQLSAIINFQIEGNESDQIKNSLMERQVICAYRGGGIRFSPHFYISEATIDLAIKHLKAICQ